VTDRIALAALADEVGRFRHLGPRLERRQRALLAALAAGAPSTRSAAAYVRAVDRYFRRFDQESRVRLAMLERRLGALAQEQYNLVAERGVAEGRVSLVQGVLEHARELARR